MRYMPDTAFNFCNFVGGLFQTPEKPRVVQYTRLLREGKTDEAMKIYNELSPLRVLFHQTQAAYLMGKGVFPLTALKYWAEQLGLPGGPVRPPFDLLEDFTKRAIDKQLREAGLVA